MSINDFHNIYDVVMTKAEAFLSSPADSDLLKSYKIYSSSFKQITQILNSLENKDSIRPQIENLLTVHKKVEDRLLSEKDSVFKKIRTTLCREHLKNKYYSKNINKSLIDKKS